MILTNSYKNGLKAAIFVMSGVLMLIFAMLFNLVFPYNKNLWSSSYVLLTSGAGILLLAFFYQIVDIMKSGKIFKPFKGIGSSTIFVYFTATLLNKSLWQIPVFDLISGQTMILRTWVTQRLIAPWAQGLDSLYFSIGYAVIWMAIMGYLRHHKIYIRL